LILESFKKLIFEEINKSLFVRHKIIYSFLLAMADLNSKDFDYSEGYSLMLTGVTQAKFELQENPI
jgi:hypothetical protein